MDEPGFKVRPVKFEVVRSSSTQTELLAAEEVVEPLVHIFLIASLIMIVIAALFFHYHLKGFTFTGRVVGF